MASDRALDVAVWATFLAALWRDIVGSPTIAMLGSYNFTVAEPIFAAAAAIVIVRLRLARLRFSPLSLLLFAFVAILVVNFVRGLGHDPMAAVISLRATGAFALALLVSVIADPTDELGRRVRFALDKVAFALVTLIALRLMFGPQLFIQVEGLSVQDINDGGRPLSAAGALLIACGAALQLSQLMRGSRAILSRDGLKLAIFLAGLLFTGQGTATICGVVGLGVVWGYEAGALRSLRTTIFLSGTVAAIAVAALAPEMFDPASWAHLMPASVADNVARRQTNLEMRQIVWDGVLSAYSHGPMLNQLVGWPLGASPLVIIESRNWGSVAWEASAHSMYFGTLITHGVVGVTILSIALALAAGIAFKRAVMGAALDGGLSAAGSLSLVVMMGIFSYSYNLSNEMGLILAMAFVALQARPRRADNELTIGARFPDQMKAWRSRGR